MSSTDQPSKRKFEKYETFMKELRLQKSIPILEKIYEDLKANKENLFNGSIVPYQYSSDLIIFLKYNLISAKKQLDIFKLYIESFLDPKTKLDKNKSIQFFFDIFYFNSNYFYQTPTTDNFIIFLKQFFNHYYPKDTSIKHKVGDIMDVFISEDRNKLSLKGWIQLKIKEIEEEKKCYVFEDHEDKTKNNYIIIDNFLVQERNTFVTEEEMNWRDNLKPGDKLDFLTEKNNWVEATVKEILPEDKIRIETFGESEGLKLIYCKYSPFIQPYLKYSFKYEPDEANCIALLEENTLFQRLTYIAPSNEKNHLIPHYELKYYSMEYYEIFNFFIDKIIESKILSNESTSIEYIYAILDILITAFPIINQKFFAEYIEKNCFENIKNILIKFSLDKKVNNRKIYFEKIIQYLQTILTLNHYPYQLCNIFPEFIIEFGFNCFKYSESLEKRLLGLNSIFRILEKILKYYLILPDETTNKISKVINDKMFADDITNNDFLGLLFNNPDIHQQLLIAGVEVICLLAKLRLLKNKDIERIYNFSFNYQPDSDVFKSIFIILNIIPKEMDLTQQKVICNRIIALPYEKIRENDLTLMSYILQSIKSDKDFKELAETFLNYYYDYIIQYQKKVDDPYSKFANILTYPKSEENLKYLLCLYFEKTVDDLDKQDNMEDYYFFFNFIYYIFGCINEDDEKVKQCLPFIKTKFREIFLKNNKNMEIIVDKLMDLNNKNNKEEIKNENNITTIIEIIIKLIDFIEEKNFYTLESMKKLSEYYVFSDVLRKKRSNFLYKIKQLKSEVFDKEKFLEYFFNRFNSFLDTITPENPEKYKLLDDLIIASIFEIYLDINKPKKEELSPDKEMNDYLNSIKEYQLKQNPLKTKYFDIIWKMFLKYDYCTELNQFLELFELKNFTPSERHEIWEQLIQKIFENIDNNISISLKMLEIIINISEKYGSGGAKSHFIDLKKKFPIKLNINNDISNLLPEFYFSKEEKPFYSTDSIYDIKKRIKDKYGIDPIFFEIEEKKSKIADDTKLRDNKALIQIYPELEKKNNEEINIFFKKGKILKTFSGYPLKMENDISPKFQEVLQEIFNKFAKDGKLDINSFRNFFIVSMGVKTFGNMETMADLAFYKFDDDKKGYWSFENFSKFFFDPLSSKRDSINTNLINHGYTPNLEYYLSPLNKSSPFYYEENNVKEYMPRYFIGNNKQYMDKIFSFAKDKDKNIVGKAQNLLRELCTSEEMKKNLFEKENKIEDIISNDNLELRSYAFDILGSEFEKEEKDESKQNLLNNFFKNNINKIIDELEKFSKKEKENEKEENKIITYFNYYLSNLKIILHTFKNIMENNDITESIDKFEDLEDDNEKNIFKASKIELNEEKMNLIQNFELKKLLNILCNNIIIMNEKVGDIYNQGILCSIKIFIYILLFSQHLPEKEKTEIYEKYINCEITFSFELEYYTKNLIYLANKLLLNFMNNETDLKYILIIYDELSKEIIKYDKLNKYDWKITFFFYLFIDIFKLSIKALKIDKIFTLFEELLKLILDKNIVLKENLLEEYLNIINEILTILKKEKYNKLYEYDFGYLIEKLINEFIISFESEERDKIIEVNNIKNYSKYSEQIYLNYLYQILTKIISLNPEKYLKLFFFNENIKNLIEKHLTKIDESLPEYNPYESSRNYTNYIGLKNLSSICYMNSVLQQFFMMPFFRNAILSLQIPNELPEDKEDNDNLLFQLIRMFYYLNYSDKGEYNPKNFVFSFKDFDGNPTRIDVQCDAQEFLSRLIEKVDDSLKNNKQRFLIQNILGGTTLQRVKCTNPECGNVSEKRDNINFLSLDIKGVKSVKECLNNFIKEEKIEGYHCEKCDKKITNVKNVLIDKIPNILIIHLQRITFSYTTFNMEKINSYITFDKTLNIKDYTVNKDNEEINSEFYDYDLQGILIHSGSALYGHYYSLISKEEEKDDEVWLKFNDRQVSLINYERILADAYGDSSPNSYGSSAYMLIYQKRIKKPVIIDSKELEENIQKLLEEKKEEKLESIELDKDKVFYLYENERDAIEKNTDMNSKNDSESNLNKNIIIKNNLIEAKLVSYEEALNLLIKENKTDKEKKPFLKSILSENIKICNDKKFFNNSFSQFINEGIKIIKEEISSDKTGQKINEYIPILKIINDYIIHIISFYNNQEEFETIIQNMIDIYENSIPKELLSFLIKEFIEPNKDNLFLNFFCNRSLKKGKIISTYIARILSCSINNNIENELSYNIIKFYLDKIPVEITKYSLDMEGFNNLILTLIEHSDNIKQYFIKNEIISKLIDLIMGKESLLYKGDQRISFEHNRPRFEGIIKSISLLYKYYMENYQKEELKLSKDDIIMINDIKFYEKLILNECDEDALNLLLDYKIELDMVLDKEEKCNTNIIDIIIISKIPLIKNMKEKIYVINLVTNIIKKYAEIYKIDNNQENIDENNKEKFLEILNILLGLPIPLVSKGEAEIKYISGKFQDKYSILSIPFIQKNDKKESIDLLKPLFKLFNLNSIVYNYINKLPAPNSFKYSLVDYCIKLFFSLEKEISDNDLNKDLNNLINEICTKNNKDLNSIKNSDTIDLDNSLYFHEFLFHSIKHTSIPENVKLFQGKLYYISSKNNQKTTLACFTNPHYFTNLEENKTNEDLSNKDGNELHIILCFVIYSEKDQNIYLEFKPYFNSTMEIRAKKENHYFLYCMDLNDDIKNNDEEIDKNIEYNNIKIKTEEQKIEEVPAGNNMPRSDEGCAINCQICGQVNILNEGNTEFKCIFCESPLF